MLRYVVASSSQFTSLTRSDKKWSYEVHVPRALIGEYLAALKDSKEVLESVTSLLESSEMGPAKPDVRM